MHSFNTQIKKLNNIYIKLEYKNPAGSIKDRPAVYMLFDAYNKGYTEIVEATSGNTGIALAYYGKYFNIKPTIFMPSSFSIERQKIMKLYGANLILVDGNMKDAINKAKEYAPYIGVGNGNNDIDMLKNAELGIAIIGKEGCSVKSLLSADIVVNNIIDAINLLLNEKRMIATLRK